MVCSAAPGERAAGSRMYNTFSRAKGTSAVSRVSRAAIHDGGLGRYENAEASASLGPAVREGTGGWKGRAGLRGGLLRRDSGSSVARYTRRHPVRVRVDASCLLIDQPDATYAVKARRLSRIPQRGGSPNGPLSLQTRPGFFRELESAARILHRGAAAEILLWKEPGRSCLPGRRRTRPSRAAETR